jgi:uncharacterized protein
MLTDPGRSWTLCNVRTDCAVATRVEPAFDSHSRRQGLLGRTAFPDGSAIIIAPCNAIHTFFMRFSIDAIFVKKDGTVVRVVTALAPWRLSISPRAYAVVEVPAGTAARTETRAGDVLQLK